MRARARARGWGSRRWVGGRGQLQAMGIMAAKVKRGRDGNAHCEGAMFTGPQEVRREATRQKLFCSSTRVISMCRAGRGGGAVYANAAWMNMFSGPLFARRRLLLDAAARARPTFTRESYEAAATRATSLATYFGARVTRPHALAASPPGNASRNALELKPTARTPTNHARKTPDGMGSTASTDMPAARL